MHGDHDDYNYGARSNNANWSHTPHSVALPDQEIVDNSVSHDPDEANAAYHRCHNAQQDHVENDNKARETHPDEASSSRDRTDSHHYHHNDHKADRFFRIVPGQGRSAGFARSLSLGHWEDLGLWIIRGARDTQGDDAEQGVPNHLVAGRVGH